MATAWCHVIPPPRAIGRRPQIADESVVCDDGAVAIRDLVMRFYDDLWNTVDLAAASTILHGDVSFRGSVGAVIEGRDGVCGDVTMVTTALSDYRCDVKRLVVEGDTAAATVLFSGVHVGDFLGHSPTGRRVEWIGAAFFHERDGLLDDVWVLGDLVTLHAQLRGDVDVSDIGDDGG